MRKHNLYIPQQVNKQTLNQKMELLTVLPAIAPWAHWNQLHWEEGCDWSVWYFTSEHEPATNQHLFV